MEQDIIYGKWFEDFEVGMTIPHALRRTVTEADNTVFTTMTMNPSRLHLDAAYMAESEYGQVLVNSLFTLSTLVGISVLETTHGTSTANLGFENVTFPAPVFIGDTLSGLTQVIELRPSASRPELGIVTFEHRAAKQSGEIVCVARRKAMMKRRPA